MKYLENAIKFLAKYWILAVPLFILTALPALITGAGTSLLQLSSLWSKLGDMSSFTDPAKYIGLISAVLALFAGAFLLALLFKLIAYPATYGMVNKGLETGSSGMNDIGQAISQNFVKYVFYIIGNIIVWLVFTIGAFIAAIILGLIFSLLGGFGAFLSALVVIALILAGVVLSVLLSLWFSVMVADNLDVVAAAKKSIEVAKTAFWTILGIKILVWLAGLVISIILGIILGWIPFIGTIISSAVPTASAFVMIVFYLLLYRDKTGRGNVL